MVNIKHLFWIVPLVGKESERLDYIEEGEEK